MRSTPPPSEPSFDLAGLPAELRARAAAMLGLAHVLHQGRPMDEGSHLRSLETRDRAFARLLLATALRRLGQIDALIDGYLERPLAPAAWPVRDALRIAAVQLLFLDTPSHAAVNSGVALTRAAGWDGLTGLANAILRRIAREGRARIAGQDAARLNTPAWLWDSWERAYGTDQARAIAETHQSEAPLDLTVKSDPEGWAARLSGEVLPTGAVRCRDAGLIEALPGYAEGAWWVQDCAAALPARLLGDVAGKHVADLCAAPGGKTAQLIAGGARVTALDRSARRLRRLSENLARLGYAAEIEAAEAETWRPATPVDAVLLDAPCSATGTIRRHPDAPYLKKPDDIAVFTTTQDQLLAAAVRLLPPGGRLIYAVCSLQPEEGPRRVAALLATGAPVRRLPIEPREVGGLAEAITPDGDLRTFPFHLADRGGMDAFFAARLEKP